MLIRDRYETLGVVGRGAEGEVLHAIDRQLDRDVAIKVRIVSSDAERDALLREARVLMSVRPHPNLPLVREDFFEGDRYFIVMDWIAGESLATRASESGTSPGIEEVFDDLWPIAEALDHLHGHQPPVIHRDVKPANIIRRPDGRVVLVDFGLSVPEGTRLRTFAGTPGFAAPELAGTEPITGAADIYGLAATSIALLTGLPPGPTLELPESVPSARAEGLEAAVRSGLAIDPGLRPHTASAFVAGLAEAAGLRRRPSRVQRLLWPAAAAVAIGVAALAGVTLASHGPQQPRSVALPLAADGVSVVDAQTLELKNASPALGSPAEIAAADGSVWAIDTASGDVLRLDPGLGTVTARIAVGAGPAGLALSGDSLWVTNSEDRSVSRIDMGANAVAQTIQVGGGPTGIAADSQAVWVADTLDDTLTRLDPRTGNQVAVVQVGDGPARVALGFGSAWVTDEAADRVSRVSVATNVVLDSYAVGRGPNAIAATTDAIWVANRHDGTISRIDPGTGTVTALDLHADPTALAGDGNNLWIADQAGATLLEVSDATRAVTTIASLGTPPQSLATSDEGVVIATRASAITHRGGTLIAVTTDQGPGTLDPAHELMSGNSFSAAAMPLLYDTLVAYRHAGGIAASSLVPDLARSVPQPSSDGLTYTFTLRPGVVFSDGNLVVPADVRRSFERVYAAAAPFDSTDEYRPPILGVDSCTPERCDLSAGILLDDANGSITIRLTAPDPEFGFQLADPLFSIVPRATGFPEVATAAPGTGPYVVRAGYPTATEVILERNPAFHVWSADARPDGFSDSIDIRGGLDASAAVAAVLRGDADVDLYDVPPDMTGPLAHPYSTMTTFYVFMNTTVAPFDDPRVRTALNQALDKVRVAQAVGGLVGRPTCQVLPPGLAGYQPYCPFGSTPGTSWSGPDLAKAQQLVDDSGTRGLPVTVWTSDMDGRANEAAATEVARTLTTLGYKASVRVVPGYFGDYRQAVGNAATGAQIGLWRWGIDLPIAQNFFDTLLSCKSRADRMNGSEVCDPDVDGRIALAESLELRDPAAADATWADLDRTIVDIAAWVPYANEQGVDLISQRVGNYQHSPSGETLHNGIPLDQLWTR